MTDLILKDIKREKAISRKFKKTMKFRTLDFDQINSDIQQMKEMGGGL